MLDGAYAEMAVREQRMKRDSEKALSKKEVLLEQNFGKQFMKKEHELKDKLEKQM